MGDADQEAILPEREDDYIHQTPAVPLSPLCSSATGVDVIAELLQLGVVRGLVLHLSPSPTVRQGGGQLVPHLVYNGGG